MLNRLHITMKTYEIEELRAVLPKGRTLFAYFKDKYCLQLLRYAIEEPVRVASLRRHPVASLLQKPMVKNLLATCGDRLDPQTLEWTAAATPGFHYILTLGSWGRQDRVRVMQTTRKGTNLVLQLNFNNVHNQAFTRLIKPREGSDPFNYRGHPALKDARSNRRYTLGWARLDMDLHAGEALIEELQTDWLRQAQRISRFATRLDDDAFTQRFHRKFGANRNHFMIYYSNVLASHYAIWDEALLCAVLFFLREELGIRKIWMHTPQSGVLLKKIRGTPPPISLYSKLPQRFYFRAEDSLPEFLAQEREVMRTLRRHPGVGLQKFTL